MTVSKKKYILYKENFQKIRKFTECFPKRKCIDTYQLQYSGSFHNYIDL